MNLPLKAYKHPVVLTSAFIVIAIFLKSLVAGTLGQIGTDSDDVMRLMQIRDFFNGQSWFDVTQTRMGPDGGTAIHWSRIVDIPMIVLTAFFDLFLSYETAETLAITIWPPLCSLFVIWGGVMGARHMDNRVNNQVSLIFTLILLALFLIPHYRFSPGSIDHHNLQMGLLAVAIGYALDAQMRRRSFFIAGVALGLSVAAGAEVYVFVAIICGFFALNWMARPSEASEGTAAFGLGFALTLAIAFFTTIAPENYLRVECDAFSIITMRAGIAGGIGLTLCARLLSQKSTLWRLVGLGVVGGVCLILIASQAPQCLSNPMDILPEDVRVLWLDNISEAQPLFANRDNWFSVPPYAIGTSLVAIIVTLSQVKKGQNPGRNLFLCALLMAGLIMGLYQIRFCVFGLLISIFVLGPWVARVYEAGKSKDSNLAYILALALSMPLIWGAPGSLLTNIKDVEEEAKVQAGACYTDEIIMAMRDLEPGFWVATSNATPTILTGTSHRVMSGNYHRNYKGILANIQIFTDSPDKALVRMKEHGINYVHICRKTGETQVLIERSQTGLMAKVVSGDIPDYLEPIGTPFENGVVSLYRVKY